MIKFDFKFELMTINSIPVAEWESRKLRKLKFEFVEYPW